MQHTAQMQALQGSEDGGKNAFAGYLLRTSMILWTSGASCFNLMSPSPLAVRLCHILSPRATALISQEALRYAALASPGSRGVGSWSHHQRRALNLAATTGSDQRHEGETLSPVTVRVVPIRHPRLISYTGGRIGLPQGCHNKIRSSSRLRSALAAQKLLVRAMAGASAGNSSTSMNVLCTSGPHRGSERRKHPLQASPSGRDQGLQGYGPRMVAAVLRDLGKAWSSRLRGPNSQDSSLFGTFRRLRCPPTWTNMDSEALF